MRIRWRFEIKAGFPRRGGKPALFVWTAGRMTAEELARRLFTPIFADWNRMDMMVEHRTLQGSPFR